MPIPKPKPRTKRQKRSLRQVKSEQKFGTSPPPVRDEGYLSFLRSHACTVSRWEGGAGVCQSATWALQIILRRGALLIMPRSTAAHPKKATSGREKVGDDQCIPLCEAHHAEQELNHDAFDRKYGIDRYELAKKYYARYLEEKP